MPELPIEIKGTVKPFKGNGRRLGCPTANITTDSALTDGVYFGYANLGSYSHHPTLFFIGTPTTVGDTGRRLEAHLLDIPDVDYYEQELEAELHHYHRPSQDFSSIDELKKAMAADDLAARKWFDQA